MQILGWGVECSGQQVDVVRDAWAHQQSLQHLEGSWYHIYTHIAGVPHRAAMQMLCCTAEQQSDMRGT